MAKIYAPNKQYSGVSASVPFVNGVGETENKSLIDWFKEHGYSVEGDSENSGEPDMEPPNGEGIPEPEGEKPSAAKKGKEK